MADQELSDEQAQSLGLEEGPRSSGVDAGLMGGGVVDALHGSRHLRNPPTGPAPSVDTSIQVMEPGVLSDNQARSLGLDDSPGPQANTDTKFNAWRGAQDATTPQQAADAAQHSKETGLTPQFAAAALPELKKAKDEAVLGGVMQSAPSTQSWISASPANAAHVKDEPGVFAALEWGLTGRFENVHHDFFGQGIDSLEYHGPAWTQAFADSWRLTRDVYVPQFERAHGMTSSDAYGELSDADIANSKAELDKDYGANSWLSKRLIGASKLLGYGSQLIAATTAATVAAPSEAAAVVGGGASWIFNHISSFGPAYDRLKAEGASDDQARNGADVVAGITSTLMELTGGYAKYIPGLNKLIAPVVADATAEALAKKTLGSAALGFGKEAIGGSIKGAGVLATAKIYEEATSNTVRAINGQASAGTPADLVENAKAVGGTFVQSLVDMLSANVITGVPTLMRDVGRANTLKADARQLELMLSSTEQSRTAANHPSEAAEFIRQAQPDGPVVFHIPAEHWDEYWQEKKADPAAMAEKVGANYPEAKAMGGGGELLIPADKYLTTFAKTEHLRGLEDLVHLNQDGLSLKQVRILDEATPRQEGDGSDAIEKEFTDKALAAGTPRKVAEGVGKLVSSSFRTFAEREGRGRTPLEVWKDFPLNIHGPDEAAQMGEALAAQRQEQPGLPPQHPAEGLVRSAWEAGKDDARFQKFFVDTNTGVMNARGFRRLPVEGKPLVAHVSAEGVAFENDTKGHPAGNNLFRTAANALHSEDPNVAKVGGDFALRVASVADAKALVDKANESMPPGHKLTFAVGNDFASAAKEHGKLKKDLESDGKRAKRKSKPIDLQEGFRLPEAARAKAEVPATLRSAYDAMTPGQRFREVHYEDGTGLLTAEGEHALGDKGFKSHIAIDVDGLSAANEKLTDSAGDALLAAFGTGAANVGGLEHNLAHPHGDEYEGKSPHDEKSARDFAERLTTEAKDIRIIKELPDGSFGVIDGVGFSYGVGATRDAAETALREHKAQRQSAGERGDTVNERRFRKYATREEALRSGVLQGTQALGDGRAPGDGGAPNAAGGQEVTKLEQGDLRFEKKGGRGYITFTSGEGGKPRRFDIHLLENADESTLAHESFHFLSEVMSDLSQKDTASEGLRQDYQTLLGFVGHDTHEDRLAARKEVGKLSKLDYRTPEQESRLKELTGKEERLAHAWEAFLAEGKSPSLELARVFSRFKGWMLKLYKQGVLGIQQQFQEHFGEPLRLSDDVRGVFNRLLASEKGIDEASRGSPSTEAMPKLSESMTPEQQLRYAQSSEDARIASEGELVRRIAKGQSEETKAFMGEERGRLSDEAAQELANDPAMRTLRYFEKGDLPEHPGETPAALRDADGGPLKINRGVARTELGAATVKALPRPLFAAGNGGTSVEDLAQRLGWDSGTDMVKAIAGQPRYADALKAATEGKLKDLYGHQLLDKPDELAAEAMDSLHNEKAMQKALLELQHMRRLLDKDSDQRTSPLSLASAKAIATRLISTKTVGQLTAGEQGLAGYYRRAQESAAERAFRAMDNGNVSKAYAEKSAQLLNMALHKEAQEQRDELLGAERKLSSTPDGAWKDADPALRDAHDAILGAVGFREKSGQPLSIEPFLAKAKEVYAELAFDDDAIRQLVGSPKDWKQLTPEEATNVRDAALNIRHLARNQREVVIDGKAVAKSELFGKMEEAADVRGSPKLQPRDAALEKKSADIGRFLRNVDAKLSTPDTLLRMLDGGKDDGPFRQAVEGPLTKARDTKRELTLDVTKKIVDLWNGLPKEVQDLKLETLDLSRDLPLPRDLEERFGGPVTRPYLWMTALNMGNSGNKQRLLEGYGWNERQVMNALDKYMTKPEWDFVQGTWDVLNTLYPHLAALHERETGVRLPKVEATPVVTKHGTYEGGYFPAREDPRSGAKSGPVRQTPEMVADIFGDNYQRASVASGHRKARAQQADYVVNLNWSVVPSHIAQAVHDIAYREPVRQIAGIMMDQRFRDIAEKAIGNERAGTFPDWLKAVANESADSTTASTQGLNRALGWVRGRAMRTQLGGNLASMAKHILDPALGVAAGVTTPQDTVMAMAKLSNPVTGFEMRRFALENSKELQARDSHRLVTIQREMKEVGAMPPGGIVKGLQYTAHGAQEFIGAFHDTMDKAVTTITWTAAYTKAQREAQASGRSQVEAHADSVRAGEAAIRRVYPSSEMQQMSAAMRDKGVLGMSMMFMGFANKVWNLKRHVFDDAYLTFKDPEAGFTDKAGAVTKAAAKMAAFAVIGGAPIAFLSGRGKRDDESTADWVAATSLAEPFSDTPVVNQIAEAAAKSAVSGRVEYPNFKNAPVLELAADLYKKAAEAAKDQDLTEDQKLERYIETLTTLAFAGSGATQIQRSLDYGMKLNRGEVSPRGPADVAGGFIYGDRKGNPANPLTAAQSLVSE